MYTGLHRGEPIPAAIHALCVAQTQGVEAQVRWSDVLGSLPSEAGILQLTAELAWQDGKGQEGTAPGRNRKHELLSGPCVVLSQQQMHIKFMNIWVSNPIRQEV